MNRTDFEKLDAELLAAADAVLKQRRGAYAADGDVLQNFKEIAKECNLSVAKTWEVMFRKALKALRSVVEGNPSAGETNIERAADALNYVRLGWAIANEQPNKVPGPKQPKVVRESLAELMRREQVEAEKRAAKRDILDKIRTLGDVTYDRDAFTGPALPVHARNRYVD